jgi:hypothetical protein
MNKKKTLLFLILLIAAIGAMWTLDYLSSAPPTEGVEMGGVSHEPKVVTDFKLFCDSLEKSNWEPEAFQERVDRLNVYKTKDIVNASEFLNLEEYMYSAYASSMINSFEEWKSTCVVADLKELNKEMKRVSTINSVSRSKLNDPLNKINDFYALLSMPKKVDKMLKSEYDASKFDQLLSRVKSLSNHFSSCSNVNTVKKDAENALNLFKSFAIDFIDARNAYQLDSSDGFTHNDLRKLCNLAKSNNYTYYKNQLNGLNGCN